MKRIKSTKETKEIERLKNDTTLSLDCKKDVSILLDKNKKQFSIKIPKEIVEIYRIKKGEKFRFIVKIEEGKEEPEGHFEVLKNE